MACWPVAAQPLMKSLVLAGHRSGRHTDCAVQTNSTKDISGTALGVAVKPSRAKSGGSSGSKRSGSDAGSEGEDGVMHIYC